MNKASRFRTAHRNALLDVFARQLQAFEQGRMPDMLLVRAVVDDLNRYLRLYRRHLKREHSYFRCINAALAASRLKLARCPRPSDRISGDRTPWATVRCSID